MTKKCSICGCSYRNTFVFRNGYVCENCLSYLRDKYNHTHEE